MGIFMNSAFGAKRAEPRITDAEMRKENAAAAAYYRRCKKSVSQLAKAAMYGDFGSATNKKEAFKSAKSANKNFLAWARKYENLPR